ncbi:DinB family protein [Pseudalkalibacillus hwajinpoensis]|uniref:DinB family protein n=1 Tax=Guptibacillus hwajinpoensis TaxID=208199 RepID=UPI001CFE5921|nr:DinB family protein [Pseudalkalibacillus hwajinpoensis]
MNTYSGGYEMFRSLEDFVPTWERETAQTTKLLSHLTDESLSQQVAPNHFTLEKLGIHLSQAITYMMSSAGLDLAPLEERESYNAKEIAALYKQTAEGFVRVLQEQWSDEKLLETTTFFGSETTYGSILLLLLQHQTHHRGQMTVLMRQAGLTVPGMVGPSREEWAAMKG